MSEPAFKLWDHANMWTDDDWRAIIYGQMEQTPQINDHTIWLTVVANGYISNQRPPPCHVTQHLIAQCRANPRKPLATPQRDPDVTKTIPARALRGFPLEMGANYRLR